eukprot:m51a1_g5756 putative meckelin (973) ;mRNA; r:1203854-1207921
MAPSLRLVVAIAALACARAASVLTITESTSCTGSQYFDYSTVSCQTCPNATIPDSTGPHRPLPRHGCRCRTGYAESAGTSGQLVCTNCVASSKAASFDQSRCVACGTNTTSSGSSGPLSGTECQCSSGSAAMDVDVSGAELSSKVCVACPSNSYPAGGRCVRCPDKTMTYTSGSCQCATNYQNIGGTCLSTTDMKITLGTATDTRVMFSSVRSSDSAAATSVEVLQSAPFVAGLAVAVRACEVSWTQSACQRLANLCALQYYDDSTTACSAYKTLALQRQRGSSSAPYGISEWPNAMPWLYYSSSAPTVLSDQTLVDMKPALQASEKACTNGVGMPPYVEFGKSTNMTCQLDLRALVEELPDTLFQDLYLVDTGASATATATLKPVPVLMRNLLKGSSKINWNDQDLAGAQLTRRFFVSDTVSGRTSSLNATPTVVRYPKLVKLKVKLQSNVEKMYIPLLMVEYGERLVSDIESGSFSSTMKFCVEFSDDGKTWRTMSYALLGVGLAIAAVLWLRSVVVWMRRNHNRYWPFMVFCVVSAFDCFSDVFFWVLFGEAFYVYVFFKGQADIRMMVPLLFDDLLAFEVILILCFAGKTFRVLHILYAQCTTDFFFIDWEKSRGKLMPRGTEKPVNAPVSVWRSLFAINELSSMQTKRILSFELEVVVVLFVLYGTSALYLAKPQPSVDVSIGYVSHLLLFTVVTVTWLVTAACEAIYHYAIRFRWIKDETTLFVDLLSVSNLSCFVLTDAAFGYYLHGRSVHAFSDTNMAGMHANLKAEQEKIAASRGLLPETDLQVFEMYLTVPFAEELRKLYFFLINQDRTGTMNGLDCVGAYRAINFRKQAPKDELVKAAKTLSAFLKDVIDHTSKTHKYSVKQEKEPLFRYLGVPPDLSSASESVFFPVKREFARSLLMGVEHDLLLWGVLVFTTVTWVAGNNPLAGALVSYALNRLLVYARHGLGRRNIAYKTLVDPRFLL